MRRRNNQSWDSLISRLRVDWSARELSDHFLWQEGLDATPEDAWRRIQVGPIPIRIPKPCDRCVITTTDQRTGERGVEPLRALAAFRRWDGKVFFAQNGVPDLAGSIAVGDPVTILDRQCK